MFLNHIMQGQLISICVLFTNYQNYAASLASCEYDWFIYIFVDGCLWYEMKLPIHVSQFSSIYNFVEQKLNSLQFFQSEFTFMAVSK